jgi:IS1 family transposase
MIAQAIKRYARRRVVEVLRRVVVGTEQAVAARLKCTQGSLTAVINTAYVERLQATFRSRLAPLARKTRATARQKATLETKCTTGLCSELHRKGLSQSPAASH